MSARACDWRNPGFAQTPRSPATCIGRPDATAYVRWLSKATGQRYRLLTANEYEYAARGGTPTAYWWGDEFAAGCKVVNSADPCDPVQFTVPLDQSKPNGFGVFEMAGNVASWTSDCAAGSCEVRGGSWASPASDLRAAARTRAPMRDTSTTQGFRIAREL